MGKKLTPEEREARAARRAERSDRTLQAKANEIAAKELAKRIRHTLTHELGVDPNDIVKLDAEGYAAKHVHAVGTPEHWPTINPVTPPEQNESHDPTQSTG